MECYVEKSGREEEKSRQALIDRGRESDSIQFLIVDSLIVSLLVSLCGERK